MRRKYNELVTCELQRLFSPGKGGFIRQSDFGFDVPVRFLRGLKKEGCIFQRALNTFEGSFRFLSHVSSLFFQKIA